jgi:hypothetical protein
MKKNIIAMAGTLSLLSITPLVTPSFATPSDSLDGDRALHSAFKDLHAHLTQRKTTASREISRLNTTVNSLQKESASMLESLLSVWQRMVKRHESRQDRRLDQPPQDSISLDEDMRKLISRFMELERRAQRAAVTGSGLAESVNQDENSVAAAELLVQSTKGLFDEVERLAYQAHYFRLDQERMGGAKLSFDVNIFASNAESYVKKLFADVKIILDRVTPSAAL